MERRILHMDMDEFFAAIERLDNPDLRGKCLLVGGEARSRGVVSTASYEARVFGCHSAMPMATAVRLCPQAVVLPVRPHRYQEVSDQVFELLGRYTPLVEPLSIDEAFLDVTGCERLLGPAERIARDIKDRIRSCLHLTASVGVASNKFLAKLASDLRKPDGLVVIGDGDVHAVLDPLPVTKLWGVGPAAAGELEKLGARTIGQLRRLPADLLRRRLGKWGSQLLELANGLDDRPVTPDGQAKSIGQEQTFPVDVGESQELRRVLLQQVEQVARRLRRHGLKCRTITLKLRYGDFTTITRSTTLGSPTAGTEEVWTSARGLLEAWSARQHRPLRLLGVTASQLSPERGGQLSLFADPAQVRQERLDKAVDGIVDRFGPGAIGRGAASEAAGRDEPDKPAHPRETPPGERPDSMAGR